MSSVAYCLLCCCHPLLSAHTVVVQLSTLLPKAPAPFAAHRQLPSSCSHCPLLAFADLINSLLLHPLPPPLSTTHFCHSLPCNCQLFCCCLLPPFASHHKPLSCCSGFQPLLSFATPINGWLLHLLSPCLGHCHIPPPLLSFLWLIIMCCHHHFPKQPSSPLKIVRRPLLPFPAMELSTLLLPSAAPFCCPS